MRATLPSGSDVAPSPEHPSLLNELTLIYLTLAYETDRELDEAEMDAITDKVSEWMPDAAERSVDDVVREAMRTYVLEAKQRVFVEAVEAVGQSIPERQQKALLIDLRHVAEADGNVCEGERRLIRELARVWELDTE